MMGLGFAGGAPLMVLADVFTTGLERVGGLCVAAGWPWLVGSSVLSATQARRSLSLPLLAAQRPLPPLSCPT